MGRKQKGLEREQGDKRQRRWRGPRKDYQVTGGKKVAKSRQKRKEIKECLLPPSPLPLPLPFLLMFVLLNCSSVVGRAEKWNADKVLKIGGISIFLPQGDTLIRSKFLFSVNPVNLSSCCTLGFFWFSLGILFLFEGSSLVFFVFSMLCIMQ